MQRLLALMLIVWILPLHAAADEKIEYVTITADNIKISYENGDQAITRATGNVKAVLAENTILADKLEYNHRTKELSLSGRVAFTSPDNELTGEKMQFNAQSRMWELNDFSITIKPTLDADQLLEPVFLHGKSANRAELGILELKESDITTCNLPNPHYSIDSRSTTLIPGEKLLLEHTTFYLNKHKLYSIPRLSIPLTEKNDLRITPLVGQSDEEGYYLKTAYNYPTRQNQTGYLLLDLMSKKGFGQGIDHSYRNTKSNGRLHLYHVYDKNISQNTFDGTFGHNTIFGGYKLNAAADFRSNSYLYAPDSKTFAERISLSKTSQRYNTRLSFNRNVNDVFTKTTRYFGQLEHSQMLSRNLNVTGAFDYSGYESGGYNEKRLTSDISLDYEIPIADINLNTHRFTDFNESSSAYSSFYGTEKLPELGIETNSRRLGIGGRMMSLSFAYGKYLELPSVTPVDRTYFAAKLPNSRKTLSNSWSISNSGNFQQFLYSDDTAQYSISHTFQIEKKLGRRSSFSLTHRFQRPDGYTPLRLDYIGRYNSVYTNLNLRDDKAHRISLSSGYDFERRYSKWQDISIRSWYTPSSKFNLYTSAGYDLNLSQWRALINQLNFRPNDDISLGIGSRYDTINHRWAILRTTLDTKIDNLTRMQMITSYNGAKKQYDYTAIRLTRDLHCWEASLTYSQQKGFQNTSGIMLNVRIKALPYYPAFGIGQYGESLDTGYFGYYDY